MAAQTRLDRMAWIWLTRRPMAPKPENFAFESGLFEARQAMRMACRSCLETFPIETKRVGAADALGRESPQEWFDALDGAVVRLRDEEWHLEVFSVVMDQAATWVQVQLSGACAHLLTLRLPTHAGVRHVTSILSSWLADPSQSTHVLNVA